MKFFFPDSQDQISLGYDFATDTYPPFRVRQRDDLYAHEILGDNPYDGVLVSKAMVDPAAGSASRYSVAQRHRLYRVGVHEFFRLDRPDGTRLSALGDCGAFTYLNDSEPPYTVDEVIDFYDECDFDAGFSLDHIILAFQGDDDPPQDDWIRRRELTIELAGEFRQRHRQRKCRFAAIGVAQGWSPQSIAKSVAELQDIGFTRIALGGMAALRTGDVASCLRAAADVRDAATQLHLLGVTRCEHVHEWTRYGVTSFDSTSPFRQAFKDADDNFYVLEGAYSALRVPQVDGNASLKRQIRAGNIDQREALRLERECLRTLAAFDLGQTSVEETTASLRAYEELYDPKHDHSETYRRTLEAAPWNNCPCGVCAEARIHVAIFRGTERNKRRGFHNIYVFRQRLRRELVAA